MIGKIISCRAVIIREDKILLMHRRKNGHEYWVFPGGHVESGESPEQAMIREVWEETNLKVTKLSQPFEYVNSTFSENECYFMCEVAEGKPKLDPSGTEKITPDNWYNPEWITLEKFEILEDVYPREIRILIKLY